MITNVHTALDTIEECTQALFDAGQAPILQLIPQGDGVHWKATLLVPDTTVPDHASGWEQGSEAALIALANQIFDHDA